MRKIAFTFSPAGNFTFEFEQSTAGVFRNISHPAADASEQRRNTNNER
jgi:hypothetical protein